MNDTKIMFSPEELVLAENASWILTKNMIIRKICDLFGHLSYQMMDELNRFELPKEVEQTSPKISKGENYRGLPYIVLDYPRFFTKENIFAIRTLFWWAHYFSVTLHLKGVYKASFIKQIKKNISFLAENNFYVGISKDEWQHAMHEDDYLLLHETSEEQLEIIFSENSFLKLSAKMELNQWNEAGEKLFHLFKIITQSIK